MRKVGIEIMAYNRQGDDSRKIIELAELHEGASWSDERKKRFENALRHVHHVFERLDYWLPTQGDVLNLLNNPSQTD